MPMPAMTADEAISRLREVVNQAVIEESEPEPWVTEATDGLITFQLHVAECLNKAIKGGKSVDPDKIHETVQMLEFQAMLLASMASALAEPSVAARVLDASEAFEAFITAVAREHIVLIMPPVEGVH